MHQNGKEQINKSQSQTITTVYQCRLAELQCFRSRVKIVVVRKQHNVLSDGQWWKFCILRRGLHVHLFSFYRASAHWRAIDIGILSVRPSVCP